MNDINHVERLKDVLCLKRSREKYYEASKREFLENTGYIDVEFVIDHRGLVAVVPGKNFDSYELAGLSSRRNHNCLVNYICDNVTFFLE